MSETEFMTIGLAAHVVGAIIWVGGLFSALVLLPVRVASDSEWRFWDAPGRRLFRWNWVGVALVFGSGLGMMLLALGGAAPLYVRAMMALGVGAVAIFAYLFFMPWRRFQWAVAAADMAGAKRQMLRTRIFAGITLAFALIAAVIGASGRHYG
jgi:uncharacterized membrane protein